MSLTKKKKTKKRSLVRLNLIPIMDAIFIFIFFLLMSAQFVKFQEIASDAPQVKLLDEEEARIKKEPLNLTLEILKKKIVVRVRGIGEVRTVIPLLSNQEYDLDKLVNEVILIKKEYISENSVVLKPENSIPYKKIVSIIDALRKVPEGSSPVEGTNKRGDLVRTTKLFDQVIFETII